MTRDRTTLALPPGQYFAEEQHKDLIVLHFTAGQSARSAYDTWMATPIEVATAYIVDLDGTVYETFNPKYWAYHLGMPANNRWHKHDKRSIGIEIVNVGPLRAVNGNWCWWPGNFTLPYFGSGLEMPYRGYPAFAPFRDAQYDSVRALIDKLCEEFDILRNRPTIPSLAFTGDGYQFTGIAGHQNFRADKCDPGPAFDWGRVGL